jgi:uncharacterized coiled-coil DUF342 family protein
MLNFKELAAALEEARALRTELRTEIEASKEFRAALRAKMKFEVEALLSMPGLRSEHKKSLTELLGRIDKPLRP